MLLVDEMMDLSIAARDDRNPAAAAHAQRLLDYVHAHPDYTKFAKEAAANSPNNAEIKAALQGIAERTHQRALGKVAADGNNPALQREASQLFEKVNRQGDPNAGYVEPRIPTADQQRIVDRHYESNGVNISRVVRTPQNPDIHGSFLETMQDLQKKVEANPNGDDAKFAARVMADPRYMANVEYALENSGLPESTQRTLRQLSETAHETMARNTRFNPPDDDTISRLNGFYSHFRTERKNAILAASPETGSDNFLDSVRDMSKRVEANPNGADAQLAARVMADPRYMQNVEESLRNSGLPESTQDTLRRISEASHNAAVTATRFNPASPGMAAQVNQFYGGFTQASPAALQADTSTTTPHTIERGESLWTIAQNHYGLTDPKQIQAAVENIAGANGLDQKTVGSLQVGREIKLPDSPARTENSPSLDWAAMDRDAGKLRGSFRPEATASASVVQPENPAAAASVELAAAAPSQLQDFSRRSGSAFDRMTCNFTPICIP